MLRGRSTQGLSPGRIAVTPARLSSSWLRPVIVGDASWQLLRDSSAPSGTGVLRLQTGDSPNDKVQLLTKVPGGLPLTRVTGLYYETKSVAGPPQADASYQLGLDADGDGAQDTILVYEPYLNGTVNRGEWQRWNVTTGRFWSTQDVYSGDHLVVGGSQGGPPYTTLAQLRRALPHAAVTAVGVNLGRRNPGWGALVDRLVVNKTTFDFEAGG